MISAKLKTVIPFMPTQKGMANCILLNQDSVRSTDMEVELSAKIPMPTITAPVLIDKKTLADRVKSGSEIAYRDGELFAVNGSATAKLKMESASDYPTELFSREVFEYYTRLLVSELADILDQSAYAMADRDVRYYLNGMHFGTIKGLMRVQATDGRRLARIDSCIGAKGGEFIIPDTAVKLLQKILKKEKGTVKIEQNGKAVRFSVGIFTLTTKKVDGKFPDCDRVIPVSQPYKATFKKAELLPALEFALTGSNKYCGVGITAVEGGITILACNEEGEETTATVSGSHNLPAGFVIGFAATILIDAITNTKSDAVEWGLTDKNSCLKSVSGDENTVTYVIMPMRL